jgi:hypothetical protein
LFSFNIGVELGQFASIAVVLGAIALAKRIAVPQFMTRYAIPTVTFAIGTLAAFRFVERVVAFMP